MDPNDVKQAATPPPQPDETSTGSSDTGSEPNTNTADSTPATTAETSDD